jgi:acyl-coenzyme A thioesterase PaaI-like protein
MSSGIISTIVERLPVGVARFIFNRWPPFRGAGIKVKCISADYRRFEVSLKLGLLNRNYAGVHFGGSLFAMIDPFFMLILSKNLGKNYVVWDKAGTIDFKKPGRGTIKAKCFMSEEEINFVREEVDRVGKYVFDKSTDLLNEKDEVVATIVKTIYVRRNKK